MTGRTGVGKSTMTEILFGSDFSALESKFDELHLCIKIKNTKEDPSKAEHSMFVSDTICPKLFTDPLKPQVAIYDCPGFADTRGTSNEIATGVYLSQIVQHANRVKIVATVDYDTVKPNADRSKFTETIVPEVLDFVLSNDIYQGGVFLLVTKYANPIEESRGKFSDEDIVEAIALFLREAQDCAMEKFRDRRSAINALFRKSWLQQKGGKYSNIGFSRTIIREGKLSDMEALTRRSQIHAQLLDNPSFSFMAADPKNFGCPISLNAKIEIRKVLRNLENEAQDLLKTVSQKVVSRFSESAKDKEKLASFFDHYVSFLNNLGQRTGEESSLSLENLQVLNLFSTNINADTGIVTTKLNETVKRMKYLSNVDIEDASAVWKGAHGKWNEAMVQMAKDLMTEFRKAQQSLATEADQLLKLVVQRVVIKFAQSNGNFEPFFAFFNNVKQLNAEDSGLSVKSLELLRELGSSIGDDLKTELDKLAGIISSLKYLTGLDGEQSSVTWSDVHMKWDHAMEFLEKNIAELKAQRDLTEAEAQHKQVMAKAEEDLVAAKAEGELAAARAEAQLEAAKAEAMRAQVEAEKQLILAKAETEKAAVRAQAEIDAANQRAKLAESAVHVPAQIKTSDPGVLGKFVDVIGKAVAVAVPPLVKFWVKSSSSKQQDPDPKSQP